LAQQEIGLANYALISKLILKEKDLSTLKLLGIIFLISTVFKERYQDKL
jgi:hypothetical protein